MPSPGTTVPVLSPQGFRDFSDCSDNLNLQNLSQIDKSHLRIFAGNDSRQENHLIGVSLDNIVAENPGSHWFTAHPGGRAWTR
jgi:hypothetical protein